MQKSGSIIHASDFYKTGHPPQYPEGTTQVYSNFTARGSRLKEVNKVVVFGLQYFVQEYLVNRFQNEFFKADKDEVLAKYKRRMDTSLGPDAVPVDRWAALHDLGYLPLLIKALPEGSRVDLRVPFITIKNTHPDFFWLTNWVESLMSNVIWHPITVATIAYSYWELLNAGAVKSSDHVDFVQWQGHDFSYRGMDESAAICGAAHLLSFTGTDTIPAIDVCEDYYGANAEKELIGGSIPATEHSVMCMGGEASEFETFRRLIEDVYPSGPVSIVSDTWDYWKILTETLPALKDTIMNRNGKVVIRPDSGDPVKIICGDRDADILSPEYRGTIQVLWDVFGGTINSKGYKELDTHIGAIYGDSITYERANQITDQLMQAGFASTNIVFGIGSFTYQYVTRDTFGMAMKATSGVIKGQRVTISKNPKTDDGLKKSAKGLLVVQSTETGFKLFENVSEEEEAAGGDLAMIYENGLTGRTQSLAEIRARLKQRTYCGVLEHPYGGLLHDDVVMGTRTDRTQDHGDQIDAQETQSTISQWAQDTFGPSSSNLRIAIRANEEMAELLKALIVKGLEDKAAEEVADVFIVLYRLATELGRDLHEDINKKMKINRARTWTLDGSGCAQHVKETQNVVPQS